MSPGARALLLIAALYGASGVALGALGAHGLAPRLGAQGLATWQTGVLYQLLHSIAMLAIVLAPVRPALAAAGWAFAVGVIMFSGSLYLLSLGGPGWLGPVTPLGGIALIGGWLLLAAAALRPRGAP
jgi:uncharacterized membrane protein YgdD (TMEM256/DUF423 family)